MPGTHRTRKLYSNTGGAARPAHQLQGQPLLQLDSRVVRRSPSGVPLRLQTPEFTSLPNQARPGRPGSPKHQLLVAACHQPKSNNTKQEPALLQQVAQRVRQLRVLEVEARLLRTCWQHLLALQHHLSSAAACTKRRACLWFTAAGMRVHHETRHVHNALSFAKLHAAAPRAPTATQVVQVVHRQRTHSSHHMSPTADPLRNLNDGDKLEQAASCSCHFPQWQSHISVPGWLSNGCALW